MRKLAVLCVATLTACSGGAGSSSPIVARAPVPTSSTPASTSSQTRATFVIHWPANAQAAATSKRRQTLSPSTQSISVTVNGSSPTVVNKPTTSGSPATTSVSIAAPPGNDGFTFTAWDQLDATGNVLDQSTVNQSIVANATNTVSVALDGICAALVPTLSGTPTFITYQNTSAPLVSGSRTILQSARLIGPSAKTIAFTRVDADGNTILTSAGVSPIAVQESGTTPHVTIAPVATGSSNTSFTLTPIAAEPDGFSTTVTATAPDCGTGTPTFPNSFQLTTSAEIVIADGSEGLLAFDQDGTALAQLSTALFSGVAYNSKSGYLVGIDSNSNNGIAFKTLGPTGSAIGSGTFTPAKIGEDTNAPTQSPGQIAYDPANGNFFFALQSSSTTVGGALEEYSIAGSTATYVAANDLSSAASDVDPVSVAVDSRGNVLVNDENASNIKNNVAYTYSYPDTLASISYSSTEPTTSLSFDSTRNNIIGFNPDTTNAEDPIGLLLTESLSFIRIFDTPANLAGANILSSAYNPGNDELYMFIGNAFESADYGLSGPVIYDAGSNQSNLPSNAFPGVYLANQEVVLP